MESWLTGFPPPLPSTLVFPWDSLASFATLLPVLGTGGGPGTQRSPSLLSSEPPVSLFLSPQFGPGHRRGLLTLKVDFR